MGRIIIEQIRTIREKKRIKSAYALSKLVGLKKDTVLNLERSGDARLKTLFTIADYFGYDVVLQEKKKNGND